MKQVLLRVTIVLVTYIYGTNDVGLAAARDPPVDGNRTPENFITPPIPRTDGMMVGFPVLRTRIFLPQPQFPPRFTITEIQRNIATPRTTIPTTTTTVNEPRTTMTETTIRPRTAPMVIGFPVFRTRVFIPPTPPEFSPITEPTMTTGTTATGKPRIFVPIPTTVPPPPPSTRQTSPATTRIITTTTPEPRTEPMVIGFPVFSSRFVTPSSPPEPRSSTPKSVRSTVLTSTSSQGNDGSSRTTRSTTTKHDLTTITIPIAVNLTTNPHTDGNESIVEPEDPIGPPVFEERTAYRVNASSAPPPTVISLCGYPPYYDRKTCLGLNYFEDPLLECEQEWGRILFGILVGTVGAAIIFVNGLIIVVVVKNPDMRTHYDMIKVSLAIADVIIGFLIFISILPNMSWVREITEEEMVYVIVEDTNSPAAIVIGSLLSMTMQASMLHLCFLSIERFLSIKVSFWLLRRRSKSVTMTLAAIWIVSFFAAFSPAIFPQYFEYKFQPALLIHMLTLKARSGTETSEVGYEGLIYVVFTIVLPYAIMVTFCISTGIISYSKLTTSKKYFGNGNGTIFTSNSTNTLSRSVETLSPRREKQTRNIRPEVTVFVTILLMIGAFTLTYIPFVIVVALFVSGFLNCANYTIPYVIAFYIGLLNSLANGIIYSVRDPRFRSVAKKIITCKDLRTSQKIFFSSNNAHISRV